MTKNEDLSKNMTCVRRKAKSTAKTAKAKPKKAIATKDDFAVFDVTPVKKEIKNPMLKILHYFIGDAPTRQDIELMIFIASISILFGIFGNMYERSKYAEFQQQQQQEIQEIMKEAEAERFFH